MTLEERLLQRADEIDILADLTVPRVGPDSYSAALMREAVKEITRMRGAQHVWQLVNGGRVRVEGDES